MLFAKFLNLNFWQIFQIYNFDFVFEVSFRMSMHMDQMIELT